MARVVIRLEGMTQLNTVSLRAVATAENTSESVPSLLEISRLNHTDICYKESLLLRKLNH